MRVNDRENVQISILNAYNCKQFYETITITIVIDFQRGVFTPHSYVPIYIHIKYTSIKETASVQYIILLCNIYRHLWFGITYFHINGILCT